MRSEEESTRNAKYLKIQSPQFEGQKWKTSKGLKKYEAPKTKKVLEKQKKTRRGGEICQVDIWR